MSYSNDISALESEILELSLRLRELKKKKRDETQLDFSEYYNLVDGVRVLHSGAISGITGALRDLVTKLSTVRRAQICTGEWTVDIDYNKVKVSALDKKHIALCAQMLDELHPIVAKYAQLFYQINPERPYVSPLDGKEVHWGE